MSGIDNAGGIVGKYNPSNMRNTAAFLADSMRALGYYDEQDGILVAVKPNSWRKSWLHRANKTYQRAQAYSDDQIHRIMVIQHEETVKSIIEYIRLAKAKNEKLHQIEKEIDEWIPPCKELEAVKNHARVRIGEELTSEKYIADLEEVTEMPLDDSPEAVRKFKQAYIAEKKAIAEDAYEMYMSDIESVARMRDVISIFEREFGLNGTENGRS